LFSATQTDRVEELVRAGLRNPVRIKVKVSFWLFFFTALRNFFVLKLRSRTARRINFRQCPKSCKTLHLSFLCSTSWQRWCGFLQQHRQEKLIVYFLTCATVDYMYAVLSELEVRERLLFGVFVMGRNPGCFWCAIFFHAWKSAWKEEIEDHFSVY
jgi:ATP-dependent RNA helicase DDX55/SPB4